MLTDARGGGVQELKDVILPLQPGNKLSGSRSENGGRQRRTTIGSLGSLRVRLQLKVQERNEEFTEMDKMNQDRLEEMLTDEKELGIVGKLNKVKDLATQLQGEFSPLFSSLPTPLTPISHPKSPWSYG